MALASSDFLGNSLNPRPSAPTRDNSDSAERGRSRRRSRASLRRVAASILPDERVASCGRNLIPGKNAAVYRSLEHGSCHVGGVMRCSSVWHCPECSAKISARRSAEIEQAVSLHLASGGGVYFLTLTVDHDVEDDLRDLLDRFSKSVKTLFSGRAQMSWRSSVGYVGMIKALEVTWGASNGWHPHAHVLIFAGTSGVNPDDLRSRWLRSSTRHGFEILPDIGCRVERVTDSVSAASTLAGYMSKDGGGIALEMSHAHTKTSRDRYTPFDLLRAADEIIETRGVTYMPAFLFSDYADVFKGRRQHVWSRGLRDALGLGAQLDDETLANAELEPAELLLELDRVTWGALWRSGRVSEFLDACEQDGLWGADFWLDVFCSSADIRRSASA